MATPKMKAERSHLQLISSHWFTRAQIRHAFGSTRKGAENLSDRISVGIAKGGYGCNITAKYAGQDYELREEAAGKLAHILECDSCPVCGD